jgi:uncharacterized SAM-binding protein YcdF (DUF218 family)
MAVRSASLRSGRVQGPGLAVRLLNWAVALGALWFFGFLIYCAAIPTNVVEPATKVDGIVVLTGGAERLKAGMRLLRQGAANELLISGVAPGVDKSALVQTLEPGDQPDSALLSCCVTLDHVASSTSDNAQESKRWAGQKDMRSLILVTANYHMNRALLEFRRSMPGIAITAYPVFPEEVLDHWWFANPQTLWLLINEYHKNLAAIARTAIGGLGDQALADWKVLWSWIG